jgi:hypothetical protein
MPDIPTYYAVNALAKAAGVTVPVVMRLAAEGKIRPSAFSRWGAKLQPLYPESDIVVVFDEVQPSRSGLQVSKT